MFWLRFSGQELHPWPTYFQDFFEHSLSLCLSYTYDILSSSLASASIIARHCSSIFSLPFCLSSMFFSYMCSFLFASSNCPQLLHPQLKRTVIPLLHFSWRCHTSNIMYVWHRKLKWAQHLHHDKMICPCVLSMRIHAILPLVSTHDTHHMIHKVLTTLYVSLLLTVGYVTLCVLV